MQPLMSIQLCCSQMQSLNTSLPGTAVHVLYRLHNHSSPQCSMAKPDEGERLNIPLLYGAINRQFDHAGAYLPVTVAPLYSALTFAMQETV